MATTMSYPTIRTEFMKYHTNTLNIILHLITTPLGILATFLCISRLLTPVLLYIGVGVYQIALYRYLPFLLWLIHGVCLGVLLWVVPFIHLPLLYCLALLAASYVGQDVAHWLTNEPTFQSSYSNKRATFMALYQQHVFFLLPLVLDSAMNFRFVSNLLGCFLAHDDVLCTKLNGSREQSDLDVMRKWVLAQNPTKEHTTHWWFHTLPDSERATFDRLAKCQSMMDVFQRRFGSAYAVDVVEGMNEVYVAALHHSNNSDTVFYTNHCDGPFMLFPHAYVFRCILACNSNVQVRTIFPQLPAEMTMTTGDALGFDFNREVHRIETNKGQVNTEPRIVLKVHYVVYPKALPWYGKLYKWLNVTYDVVARKAFLQTLKPKNIFEQMFARVIILSTLYRYLELYVGNANILYLTALGSLARMTDYRVWILGTSFIHYLMYIATFYHSRDPTQAVSFFNFKRDVMLYKTLSHLNLWCIYLYYFQFDLLSIVLLCVGNGLAIAATRALGTDRTYFGVELGLCRPKRITAFPYNLPVPHPMIWGGILGLLGFYVMPGFRAAWPLMAAAHISFYLLHMAQEHWDVHSQSELIGRLSASSSTATLVKKTSSFSKLFSSTSVSNSPAAIRFVPRILSSGA